MSSRYLSPPLSTYVVRAPESAARVDSLIEEVEPHPSSASATTCGEASFDHNELLGGSLASSQPQERNRCLRRRHARRCVRRGRPCLVAVLRPERHLLGKHGNRSGYNSNLKGNALSFTNSWGGSPQMCSEYVDTNGQSLNSPVCHPYGWIDNRNVAYGAAHCWANSANQYPLYVNYCYTNN